MSDHRVTCISKSIPHGGHEHITHLGIQTQRVTREGALRRILAGTDKFHVVDAKTGKVAYVLPYPNANGPYLRTKPDGVWGDNLLSLPACPSSLPEVN